MNTDIDYSEIRPDRKSDTPLHMQLHEAMVRAIRSLPPNRHVVLMSERELAIRLKLNRRTTHRAYEQLLADRLVRRLPNKSLEVRQDARTRILGPYPVIGVPISMDFLELVELNDRCVVPYLEGLIGRCSQRNISCIILRAPSHEASPAEIEAFAAEHFPRLCGMIHLGGLAKPGEPRDPVLTQLLKHTEIPQVCLSGSVPADHAGSVFDDPAPGLQKMCRVLKARGFRRAGIIDKDFSSTQYYHYIARDRSQAMHDALIRNGLECAFMIDLPDFSDRALKKILDKPDLPELILCHNDHVAEKVLRLAEAKGLRVPGDLYLAGYDDQTRDPRLASVRTHPGELAAAAVDMVMDHFENGVTKSNRVRSIPTEFIDGESIRKKKTD